MTSNSVPGTSAQDPIRFSVTIFPDSAARTRELLEQITLEQLADRIATTRARTKKKLPWLKLATFGEVPTRKGCLRNNANMGVIHGIEVEHDAGTLTLAAALDVLDQHEIAYLGYSTPSHTIEAPRWRILLPTSKTYPKTARAELVARINGLLDGALTYECFQMSQSFYFGGVTNGVDPDPVFMDGYPFDLLLLPAPRYPALPQGHVIQGTGVTYSYQEAISLLDAYLEDPSRGGFWHNPMLTVTASLVARRVPEGQIIDICAPYCWGGRDDPEMLDMIASAQHKFGGVREVPAALRQALAQVVAPAADTPPQVLDAPVEPPQDAPLTSKIAYLVATRGYKEGHPDKVIRLYEPSEDCTSSLKAMQARYTAWYEIEIGPRGGENKITAYAGWCVAPNRIHIDGVRMRPDQPFPVFKEEGQVFKNTYRKPVHTGTGEVQPFLDFMERLVPDPVERGWLFDWMAYKHRHPEIPGVAVLFVADNDLGLHPDLETLFGTGRGILSTIAHRLYGLNYTAEQDFRVLDGTSAQSVYTDWQHNRVLITYDESRSSPTGYRQGERHATYEILKRIIDPAPTRRTFTVKFGQSFTGMSYCSHWIFSNHFDAMAIPADDRRITVLRNGRPPTRDEVQAILSWREREGSIAALAGFLEGRELGAFDMFRPLVTEAKATMVEAGRSEIEQSMLDILDEPSRGKVFTQENLRYALRHNHNDPSPVFEGHFRAAWRQHVTKAISENTGAQRRHRTGLTQRKLFCSKPNAWAVRLMSDQQVQIEAEKWGTKLPGLG